MLHVAFCLLSGAPALGRRESADMEPREVDESPDLRTLEAAETLDLGTRPVDGPVEPPAKAAPPWWMLRCWIDAPRSPDRFLAPQARAHADAVFEGDDEDLAVSVVARVIGPVGLGVLHDRVDRGCAAKVRYQVFDCKIKDPEGNKCGCGKLGYYHMR